MDKRQDNYKHYCIAIQPVTTNGSRQFQCNTLTMWNQGTQNVTINGQMVLYPGMAYTYEGYPGEMLIQSFDIVFDNERANGCKLLFIRKEYLDQV